jgi:hypothetical protein
LPNFWRFLSLRSMQVYSVVYNAFKNPKLEV